MSTHVLQYHHFLLSIPAWIPWAWIVLILIVIVVVHFLNKRGEE